MDLAPPVEEVFLASALLLLLPPFPPFSLSVLLFVFLLLFLAGL